MKTSGVSNRNLKNHTYNILKDRLVNCIYPPGMLLNEAQLAIDLETSRTPVREAISRLEMEGFVKIIPKKGIYVTDILLGDVMQIFQTRIEIEPVTLRLAAPHLPTDELQIFCQKFSEPVTDIQNSFRLDTAMHLFIIEHCGNRYLIDMMRRVFEENTRIIISSKQNQIQIHDAKQEHLEIINQLIQKEYQEAEKTMRRHIEACRMAALDFFYGSQAYAPAQDCTYKKELERLFR